MNIVSTKTDNRKRKKADAAISILLQIPQGDRFQIQVTQSQYHFCLNETIVQQIQQAKKAGSDLYIPPSLLISLLYYTFISHNQVTRLLVVEDGVEKNHIQPLKSVAKKQYLPVFYIALISNLFQVAFNRKFRQQLSFQTEITFNSYYNQEEYPVVQSNIFLHGDIFHKIQKDFLEKNSDCSIVISAHYWLTEQILSYFRKNLNLLVWEIAAFVPAAVLVYNLHQLNLISFIGATIAIIFSRPVLVNILERIPAIKSKYLNDWAWWITCTISSVIGNTQGWTNIYSLLMFFLSCLTPEIVKQILRLIWPQVGKLMIRLLSYLPY